MSVAASRAGTHVRHIGAVGPDGRWAVERLLEYGVDTRSISEIEVETAQAIIAVDSSGENSIILYPGANAQIPLSVLNAALSEAQTGDWFVCQNETNLQIEGAKLAQEHGPVDLEVVVVAAVHGIKIIGAGILQKLVISLDCPVVATHHVHVVTAEHVDVGGHVQQVPGVGYQL